MQITRLYDRRTLAGGAIFLMIASALISSLLVHENERRIAAMKSEQAGLDETIRRLWDDAERMDRDVDAAVLVSLALQSEGTHTPLKQYYLRRLHAPTNASAVTLLQLADAERQKTIDTINDTYIRRTNMETTISQREQDNILYINVAHLLQLLSVILVILSRDMQHI